MFSGRILAKICHKMQKSSKIAERCSPRDIYLQWPKNVQVSL